MSRSRHTLVTGANRGLGLEFVRQSLARGDRVVATARQPGKATALNTLAGEHPGRLHVLPLEATDARSRDELARELPLVLGDTPLDLLLNNAGVLHAGERFGHLEAEILEHSFRTNTMAPVLLTQALAPHLADGARVVNLSSRLGSIGLTTRFGTPGYAISKAALNMAAVQLAQALAPRGIVVVAVSPGWVRTDMGGENADVAPEDAVSGLLEQIDRLALADTGSFFDRLGAPIAW